MRTKFAQLVFVASHHLMSKPNQQVSGVHMGDLAC